MLTPDKRSGPAAHRPATTELADTTVTPTTDNAEQARPFQVMPALSDDEYAALRDDIAANGVRVPIDVDQRGRILDGHHRAQVCAELGIDVPTRVVEVADDAAARAHAYTVNTARRHLTRDQRRQTVVRSLLADPGLSDRQHATRCGVSPTTVGAIRAELVAGGQLSNLDSRTGADRRSRGAFRRTWRAPSPELLDAAMVRAGITSVHPALDRLPSPGMDADQWSRFCESVSDDGVLRPILLQDGVLVDGRSRLMAGALTDQPVPVEHLHAECDAGLWTWAFNLGLGPLRLGFGEPPPPDTEHLWRKWATGLDWLQDTTLAIGLDITKARGRVAARDALTQMMPRRAAAVPEEMRDAVADVMGRVIVLFDPEADTSNDSEDEARWRWNIAMTEPEAVAS